MKIRKAEEKDIPRLLALLGQVLQIHAEIRPDIFISGTTKYTVGQLAELLERTNRKAGRLYDYYGIKDLSELTQYQYSLALIGKVDAAYKKGDTNG